MTVLLVVQHWGRQKGQWEAHTRPQLWAAALKRGEPSCTAELTCLFYTTNQQHFEGTHLETVSRHQNNIITQTTLVLKAPSPLSFLWLMAFSFWFCLPFLMLSLCSNLVCSQCDPGHPLTASSLPLGVTKTNLHFREMGSWGWYLVNSCLQALWGPLMASLENRRWLLWFLLSLPQATSQARDSVTPCLRLSCSLYGDMMVPEQTLLPQVISVSELLHARLPKSSAIQEEVIPPLPALLTAGCHLLCELGQTLCCSFAFTWGITCSYGSSFPSPISPATKTSKCLWANPMQRLY